MSDVNATRADDDGDFFDDDNNKAMFLVLPAMIVIYGSCCLIYCVHKCRRYCVTQKKKKLKEAKKRLKIEANRGFHNTALILHDEADPELGRDIRGPRTRATAPPPVLVLENLDNDGGRQATGRTSRMFQETDVDAGLEDVLQTEKLEAVVPGYSGNDSHNTGNFSKEMQHLDNQLKVAFRLVNTTAGKQQQQQQQQPPPSKQPPEPEAASTTTTSTTTTTRQVVPLPTRESLAAYANWKALQRTDLPKLTLKTTPAGDTVVERIPKDKRMVMMQNNIAVPEEDLAAIAQVRNAIAKEIPKSMPDIFRQPDENKTSLKRMSSFSKRRIYLSSQ